jgi:transcription initiation factor TFIID TATA-box-binding protein
LRPKIQNVVSTADLRQNIDATRFNNFSWGRYDKAYYRGRCGYVKDEEIKGRVSLFLSGKMISTGATTMPMSIQQLEHTMDLLIHNKLAERVSLEPKIQNIVAILDLQIKLDVKKVIQSLSNYIYEPDNFPGIIYKSPQGI